MLLTGVTNFRSRLNKLLKRAGHTPMSEWSVRKLIAGPEYSVMTADRCCCATCRNYGSRAYERWIELLRCIATGPRLKILIAAVIEEQRFRSSEVITHFEDASPCAAHCRRHALASFNDKCFRSDCAHARADGHSVQPPRTMSERLGRGPRSNDWDELCFVCAADCDADPSRLLVCTSCPRACHASCITSTHADLPSDGHDWTCGDCVREHDAVAHDERCLRCEVHECLMKDSQLLVKLAKFDAVVAGVSTHVADWACAGLVSINDDLMAFHAHKMQATAQELYQPLATIYITAAMWTTLQDFWAKQPVRLSKHATCEGMANKGISVHGVMRTIRNPTNATREEFPEVDWSGMPKSPEEGGPANARIFYRFWSDSSTQDAFDTSATVLTGDAEFLRAFPWLDPKHCLMARRIIFVHPPGSTRI